MSTAFHIQLSFQENKIFQSSNTGNFLGLSAIFTRHNESIKITSQQNRLQPSFHASK